MDDLGSSNKLACDSNSIAIKCKTDNTSYQPLDMAVSCRSVNHGTPQSMEVVGANWSAFFSIGSYFQIKSGNIYALGK